MVGDRRTLPSNVPPSHNGSHVSYRAHPPCDYRSGRGNVCSYVRRSICLGGWFKREPQRAHTRRPLAPYRYEVGDARGSRRGDAPPLARGYEEPLWQALHRRERPTLHPARGAAAHLCLRIWSQVDTDRRTYRRWLLWGRPRP